jgi:tripartite ATP-independent transporter DctM subunit
MFIILLIVIVLFAVLGAPLFSVIGLTSVVNFVHSGSSFLIVPQEIAKISSMQLLYSIPLFTFAGYVLARSNASKRLVRFTKAAFGWIPGGLGIVTLITCAVFTAFTGASGVTIVALGGFLLPALLSEKYHPRFSLGLVTTSGSVGLLFPPSLPIILFGVISGAMIEKLFVAGLIPGLIIILVFSIYSMVVSRRNKIETTPFSWKELRDAFIEVKWEIPLPVLLFAGVYSGLMAISNAAAFVAAYILIVEVFILRDVKWKDLPKIMRESMVLVGAILIILSVSLSATNYIIDQEIPQKLFLAIKGFITSRWAFLIILNLFLLVVGCIMDIFSALAIIVPLILPIAEAYNVNLIHLGIIFLANLEIGYLTPPVGMNLFISSIRFNKPIVDVYRSTIIFIGLSFISLIMITYIPELSLWFMEKPSVVSEWEYSHPDGKMEQLILKNNGELNYVRAENMMDLMMITPEKGAYQIDKNQISMTFQGKSYSYRFEVYNDGKRIQFIRNQENSNLFIAQDKEIFFKNTLDTPLTMTEGKLVGIWKSGDETVEFSIRGDLVRSEKGQSRQFRYQVKNNRIRFESNDDPEHSAKTQEMGFEFKNDLLLLKENKSVKIFSRTETGQ